MSSQSFSQLITVNLQHNGIKITKQCLTSTASKVSAYGTSEGTFKQRYGNHRKSFNHEKHRTDTKLSKEHWRLKKLKANPQVQFHILNRCRPTKRTGICYLCLKYLLLNTKETTF